MAKVTNRKILVVDDEPVMQRLFSRLLGEAGFAVQVTASLQDAAICLGTPESAPALLILDWSLLGPQWQDAVAGLRAHLPDSPILFSSGYGDTVDRTAIQVLGKSDFLPKPFTPDELLAVVKAMLEH
jgi:DNA-binding response OmpR family regulator